MDAPHTSTQISLTYATVLGFGVGMTATGMVMPWLPLQVFFSTTFGVFTIVMVIAFLRFLDQSGKLFNHDMQAKELERRRMELDIEPEAELPAPVPVIAESWQPMIGGVSLKRKIYDNPPTRDFLAFLFENANGDRQIPSERAIGEMGVKLELWNTNESNEWLTYCDEQGVTAKIRETKNGNAPRRIVEGMTLDEACKKFGLPPTPPEAG